MIKDLALLVGPTDQPVCLGCLAALPLSGCDSATFQKENIKVKDNEFPSGTCEDSCQNSPVSGRTRAPEKTNQFICPSCGWPLCGPQCKDGPRHAAECKLLTKAKIRPSGVAESDQQLYSVFSILRLLLLKQEPGGDWATLGKLMDHAEDLESESGRKEATTRLTQLLHDQFGLAWVTTDDVRHCFGVLKTNAIRLGCDGEAQAVYPNVSLISHSCVSNLELLGDPGETVAFRAKRRIPAGEELTIRYLPFLQSRESIQAKLQQDWHFTCTCPGYVCQYLSMNKRRRLKHYLFQFNFHLPHFHVYFVHHQFHHVCTFTFHILTFVNFSYIVTFVMLWSGMVLVLPLLKRLFTDPGALIHLSWEPISPP